MTGHPDPLARAHQTAQRWYAAIARHLDTQDLPYVHRVVRTWLHLVRDRLTVDSAAHFAAQLPELLRGIYFDGWNPGRAPTRYDAAAFVARFASEATISPSDVPPTASAISAAFARLCSPGQLEHVFTLLPESLRAQLDGAQVTPDRPPRPASAEHLRVNALEDQVATLTDALGTLARGLELLPDGEPSADRAAKAAQEAHRILLAQEDVPT
ncbi:DUF2267 domain-containing protein [Amycolatopsis panacis]|uniref:DUF2267 domain-containing protein n=1 Tax=Amycolatopsis panacis TaxID=2340917 RepID=A0A419I6Z9_9PSEU|nr:DUF2267 domain-containing protein [Amycolatopsis panacis]RJQ87249.1 DUF2267 domain-containing protein [Amycolatopsis panacis]